MSDQEDTDSGPKQAPVRKLSLVLPAITLRINPEHGSEEPAKENVPPTGVSRGRLLSIPMDMDLSGLIQPVTPELEDDTGTETSRNRKLSLVLPAYYDDSEYEPDDISETIARAKNRGRLLSIPMDMDLSDLIQPDNKGDRKPLLLLAGDESLKVVDMDLFNSSQTGRSSRKRRESARKISTSSLPSVSENSDQQPEMNYEVSEIQDLPKGMNRPRLLSIPIDMDLSGLIPGASSTQEEMKRGGRKLSLILPPDSDFLDEEPETISERTARELSMAKNRARLLSIPMDMDLSGLIQPETSSPQEEKERARKISLVLPPYSADADQTPDVSSGATPSGKSLPRVKSHPWLVSIPAGLLQSISSQEDTETGRKLFWFLPEVSEDSDDEDPEVTPEETSVKNGISREREQTGELSAPTVMSSTDATKPKIAVPQEDNGNDTSLGAKNTERPQTD